MVRLKRDDIEVKSLLNEFKQINNSVEVVSYEVGDQSESVPAVDGFWLKVTTKNHGWLHVYYNKETGYVEWY